MANKAPIPKSQKELFKGQPIKPNRAEDIRRDNDTVGDLRIGLYDIDSCIKFYFDNVIKPTVLEENEVIAVPAIYGSPERWVSVQRDGYYRDKEGKVQCPIIMFKRTAISKDRGVARNVLPDTPRVFETMNKTYSQINRYDSFSKLTNKKPTQERYNIIIPDYINLTYDCIIWTNYVEQLNKVIEAINFAESSYWGDPEHFEFYAVVNDFSSQTEVNDGQDRIVRCSFTITLKGYIISDALQKQIVEHTKGYTVQTLTVDVKGYNQTTPYIKNKPIPPTVQIPVIVFDDGLTQSLYPGQQYTCQFGTTVYQANLNNSDNTYTYSFNPKNVTLYTLPDISITEFDGNIISYPAQKNYISPTPTQSIAYVSNSDNSYNVSFIPTQSFVLPDITITNYYGSSSYPSAKDIILPIPIAQINNSDNSYTDAFFATQSYTLPDIYFTDSTGVTTLVPSVKDIIATPQTSNYTLEFLFPVAYDNNYIATISTNQAATYTTESLTNVNVILYMKNSVITSLPITVIPSDILEVNITRTNTALESKVILNN